MGERRKLKEKRGRQNKTEYCGAKGSMKLKKNKKTFRKDERKVKLVMIFKEWLKVAQKTLCL